MLWLNVCVPQKSYVEILLPHVMFLESEVWGRYLGYEDDAHEWHFTVSCTAHQGSLVAPRGTREGGGRTPGGVGVVEERDRGPGS